MSADNERAEEAPSGNLSFLQQLMFESKQKALNMTPSFLGGKTTQRITRNQIDADEFLSNEAPPTAFKTSSVSDTPDFNASLVSRRPKVNADGKVNTSSRGRPRKAFSPHPDRFVNGPTRSTDSSLTQPLFNSSSFGAADPVADIETRGKPLRRRMSSASHPIFLKSQQSQSYFIIIFKFLFTTIYAILYVLFHILRFCLSLPFKFLISADSVPEKGIEPSKFNLFLQSYILSLNFRYRLLLILISFSLLGLSLYSLVHPLIGDDRPVEPSGFTFNEPDYSKLESLKNSVSNGAMDEVKGSFDYFSSLLQDEQSMIRNLGQDLGSLKSQVLDLQAKFDASASSGGKGGINAATLNKLSAEFGFKLEDLQNKMAIMQKYLDAHSSTNDDDDVPIIEKLSAFLKDSSYIQKSLEGLKAEVHRVSADYVSLKELLRDEEFASFLRDTITGVTESILERKQVKDLTEAPIDYALYSRGARAIPFLCTDLYTRVAPQNRIVSFSLSTLHSCFKKLLDIDLNIRGLFSHSKPHDEALKEDISPGNCVSFPAGQKIYYSFSIPTDCSVILPSHIMIGHVNKAQVPNRTSALKDFKVAALINKTSKTSNENGPLASIKSESLILGSYRYELDSPFNIQYFKLPVGISIPSDTHIVGYQIIILSNWGHIDYTCLYKVGVFFGESDKKFKHSLSSTQL